MLRQQEGGAAALQGEAKAGGKAAKSALGLLALAPAAVLRQQEGLAAALQGEARAGGKAAKSTSSCVAPAGGNAWQQPGKSYNNAEQQCSCRQGNCGYSTKHQLPFQQQQDLQPQGRADH